jgi:hypothetical protein
MPLNPTGTYILKGENQKGEIKGNFAEIRVKMLDNSRLALSFYSNKGYPEYSSGSFTDTLVFLDNKAIHYSRLDTTCQIVFDFLDDGLSLKQIYSDPTSTCGFEKGVLPLGFINKYSSNTPLIQFITRLK